MFNTFFWISCHLWDNVEKYHRARQVTDDNMAHVHCVLHTSGYKRTLGICNTYWFSIATMAAWTCPSVTLYVHCLSCSWLFNLCISMTLLISTSKTGSSQQWNKPDYHMEPWGTQSWSSKDKWVNCILVTHLSTVNTMSTKCSPEHTKMSFAPRVWIQFGWARTFKNLFSIGSFTVDHEKQVQWAVT
jgi:hypothetical protein